MYDVAIVGGGVSGCSLLYALARRGGRALLLEKENDVGVGTTKANSAIIHAGYDPRPGSLMARYNVRGNAMLHEMCADLDVPFHAIGSLVVAFTAEEMETLEELRRRGVENGVPGLRILGREEALAREPALNPSLHGALYAPTAGVVSPWELAFAQAEVAVAAGAEVRLDCAVRGIVPQDGGFVLETDEGPVQARFVVNAAGVHAADICALVEEPPYTMHPNHGQYYLLDTTQGGLAKHVIFQCPTPHGKGVLVAPTVHGNLIVGPDSAESGPEDTATTAAGLAFVREKALRSVPGIQFKESIRNFTGVRAIASTGDFVVRQSHKVPGFFEMAGISSPGLSAAVAMAEDVAGMLEAAGLVLSPAAGNPALPGEEAEAAQSTPQRRVLRFKHLSDDARAAAIEENPLYGTIVCRCETVTEGEIIDALKRPLPPRSLDAVKRRCTAGMGRCQGGFCGPRVQALIARELGLAQEDVPQDRTGMQIVLGRTKEAYHKKKAGAGPGAGMRPETGCGPRACPKPGEMSGAKAKPGAGMRPETDAEPEKSVVPEAGPKPKADYVPKEGC